MKKTLLATALLAAGFAGAAQADDTSSVTLYGIVTQGLTYQKGMVAGNKGRSTLDLEDGQYNYAAGSRFGLKGDEDLGGGLHAIFVAEAGFNPDTGTQTVPDGGGRLFSRQVYMGLQSNNWGALTFGRQYGLEDYANGFSGLWSQTPFGAGNWANLNIETVNTVGFAGKRLDNTIKYVSPSFSGFKVAALYSFDVNDVPQNAVAPFPSGAAAPVAYYSSSTNVTSDHYRAISAGVTYDNGPFSAGLVAQELLAPSGAANSGQKEKGVGLGASYDFGVLKAFAGVNITRNGNGYASVGKGIDYNSYNLGISVPVGTATTVMLGWGLVQPKGNGVPSIGANPRNKSDNIFAVAADYALSKRTHAFVSASYETAALNASGTGITGKRSGETATVGLSHSF